MKNITVTVDEATYRLARIKAAEADSSVSALVRDYLNALVANTATAEILAQEERELRERIREFSGHDRLSRDDVHKRRR